MSRDLTHSCCTRPAVTCFDFDASPNGFNVAPFVRFVNRVCTTCGAHWFGTADNVTRYTRSQWDERINAPEAA